MAFNKNKLEEKTSSIDLLTNMELKKLNLDFLFNYQVFPSNILTYYGQWQHEKRKMQVGDTIVQQVFFPPASMSLKAIFGVRVNGVIDEENRKGFSYETLEGHAECGESTFLVVRKQQELEFIIRTNSTPGNLLSRVAAPFFTLPYQAYCTRKALENVKKEIDFSGH